MTATVARCCRRFMLVFALLALVAGCGGGGQVPSPAPPQATQYLVITIDVEAFRHRQSQDHVERLIYGNFPGRGRAGIVDMMDVADRHHVKLTFFLDVLEEFFYPKQIEAVARLIVARGHDLQLHTHTAQMPDSFFARLGFPRKSSDQFTESEATAVFNEARHVVAEWGVPPFLAYRAGAFSYGRGLVQAMPKAGIAFSYNYNILEPSQKAHGFENIPLFRWENGLVEIPFSYIDQSPGHHVRFDDFMYTRTSSPEDAYRLIDEFQAQWPSPNVLVMMFHCWSLLERDPATDYFEYRDSAKLRLFDRFLASLPKHVQVVSATALSELVAQGVLSISNHMNSAEVFPN